MRPEQRTLAVVPRWLWGVLFAALSLQISLQAMNAAALRGRATAPPAPTAAALRLASLGEPQALARLLGLHVQTFDLDQDYGRVLAWLRHILELDRLNPYPLFLAARVYAESPDPARVRAALELVHDEFHRDPERRWAWLAHAALVAKHRLRDLPLARRYAAAVERHARSPDVPLWAKQMEIFILEDMNELDAARIMLGGLLESGTIHDPGELRFLRQRLAELEARTGVGFPTTPSGGQHRKTP